MAEEETQCQEAETRRTGRRLRWWMAVVILAAAAVLAILWLSERVILHSAEQKLAAIEAARAIADEENAARFYTELIASYDEAEFASYLMDEQTYYVTQHDLWRSTDYPDLARWLQNQQGTMGKLVEASKVKECRFPIFVSAQQMLTQTDRFKAMRLWAVLLVCAANNDVAESRMQDALEKYLCMIQMAKHLYQQPTIIDFFLGFGAECLALENLDGFIVEHDVPQRHLTRIELALSHTTNTWDRDYPLIRETDSLYEIHWRKQLPFFQRFVFRSALEDNRKAALEQFSSSYFEALARRRGARILVALKRFKNEFGRWPESLDEAESLAPAETFVDPINGGSFVYRLTDDNFTLYSRGRNNIDEDGEWRRGADDCLIWPRRSDLWKKGKVNVE
ncbi:MAG: hypothetical protein ACYSR4_06555 [Planctomycetota bacterium]|jgi:hypothetical protein